MGKWFEKLKHLFDNPVQPGIEPNESAEEPKKSEAELAAAAIILTTTWRH